MSYTREQIAAALDLAVLKPTAATRALDCRLQPHALASTAR